jgi:hypothetical protein
MVTQLASVGDELWVATSPNSQIYRSRPNEKPELIAGIDARFIWDMTLGPNNTMYCVTGEPGMVVAIEPKGKAKILWKSEQKHLRTIRFHPAWGLLVGGGEKGIVYQAKDQQHFYAIHETGLEEITALVATAEHIFIAAVSQAAALLTAEQDAARKGEVRSQVVRLDRDTALEVLATSQDEVILSMVESADGQLLVGTGTIHREQMRGRLYRLSWQDRLVALVHQSPSRRITHVVRREHEIAAVAAKGARVLVVEDRFIRKGLFYTSPLDTGSSSLFGNIEILGQVPARTGIQVAARFGATAMPDLTWTPWTRDIPLPARQSWVHLGEHLKGRFIQLRLTLQTEHGKSAPRVFRVRIPYRRQNFAPIVREITTMPKGVALHAAGKDDNPHKGVSYADKPERHEDIHKALQTRIRPFKLPGSLTIRWMAEDLNGDDLIYRLWMRGQGESEYRLLKENLEEPFYTLESMQFPDGYYTFKVEVGDVRSNSPGLEKTDQRESQAVLIDNTSPVVADLKMQRKDHMVFAETVVTDAIGPLTDISFSLDQSPMRPVLPVDGILDSPKEKIQLRWENLEDGVHTLTLKAVDAAQNEGFAHVTFSLSSRGLRVIQR